MKTLVAFVLVAGSAPVFAALDDNVAAQPSQPRVICRRVEALSGSHVSRVRICHTAAQWRAMSDSSVDDSMSELAAMSRTRGGYPDGVTPKGERPR